MRYDRFAYLWPPRPEQAVDRSMLHVFERRGWIAQTKKNGTCSVIAVAPDKTITAMSRHNDAHKLWSPNDENMARFKALPGSGWYVFVAELLHSKVPGIRDINYVHDCLVNDGEYLVGWTQEDRHSVVQDLFLDGSEKETPTHYVVDRHVHVPVEYESGFAALFDRLKDAPEDEGIVLKDPKQKLVMCSRQKANVAGQIKCRYGHKNFSF